MWGHDPVKHRWGSRLSNQSGWHLTSRTYLSNHNFDGQHWLSWLITHLLLFPQKYNIKKNKKIHRNIMQQLLLTLLIIKKQQINILEGWSACFLKDNVTPKTEVIKLNIQLHRNKWHLKIVIVFHNNIVFAVSMNK